MPAVRERALHGTQQTRNSWEWSPCALGGGGGSRMRLGALSEPRCLTPFS